MQFKGLTLLWQDFIAFHAPCGTVLKFVVYNSRIYDVYIYMLLFVFFEGCSSFGFKVKIPANCPTKKIR